MEKTLVLLKPSCVQRQLIGEVVSFFIRNPRIVIKAMRYAELLSFCILYNCQRGSCRQLDGNPIMAGSIDGLRSNSILRSLTKVLLISTAFNQ